MKNILDIKLIKQKENEETYEGKMKLLIKKIKKSSENQLDYYKSILKDKKIYDIKEEDEFIYIYYDIKDNIDEIINKEENKEIASDSLWICFYCKMENDKNNTLCAFCDKDKKILPKEKSKPKVEEENEKSIVPPNNEYCQPLNKNEINELLKKEDAMCKIVSQRIINDKIESIKGTGFFLSLDNEDIPFKRCLIASNYILNEECLDKNKEITLEYKNIIKRIGIKDGRKVYINKDLNYTCIEIYDKDDIKDFFTIDYNIIGKSIEAFKDKDIIILQYSKGNELSISTGKIIGIKNDKMMHNCSINNSSSGSPIISRNLNNSIIGLHYGSDNILNINSSTSIISIIENIKSYNKNYIIAEIDIKEEDINKEMQIINSFEEYKRNHEKEDGENDYKYENEKEIKENCEITINDKLIPFSYKYKFKEKGKYIIQYSFKKNLSNMSYMFIYCESLTNINLSNLKTQNVTNMSWMFGICGSLTNINFSNLNTQNVTDMSYMFYSCSSLSKIDLSNFNTQNVKDMTGMFQYCDSLINIDLANLNTQNVKDMHCMFKSCDSLKNIDLSNLNTQNVESMSYLFQDCKSLININLSNLNTQNVKYMDFMFQCCKSLTTINLSNLNTQNVSIIENMFFGCESLTKVDLSNFDTHKVYNMSGMFMNCKSLQYVDLSNFNTQNVQYMNSMFQNCKSLTNVNLSNFNIQNVKHMEGIFAWCKSLKKEGIIVKDQYFKNYIDNYFG